MKTLLICHGSAALDEQVLTRWLHSFSDLVGVVLLHDPAAAMWRRVRREIKRSGGVGFADVLAFRLYYRLFLASQDAAWERETVHALCKRYQAMSPDTPVLRTSDVNALETQQFIANCKPDIMLARCKVILKERIFSIPTKGTFVMHPGFCPEYRNAHGCFWALANGDLDKVAMTLLRIDSGVDTGPVFGYYSYPFDEVNESHIVIQHRVVLENLDGLRDKLMDIFNGIAQSADTTGHPSRAWGQPWLSKYVSWKRAARRRRK